MRLGDIVADRFQLETVAGSGGMGTVYRALDLTTREPVALKVLLGAAGAERFEREARILAEASHPSIVRYIARGSLADGAPYLAMEWLGGIDLAERLARGPLSISNSILLAQRVGSALSFLHKLGVIHRDLKPSNLFLPGEREGDVKLLDFGIALPIDPSREITRAGTTIGTPGYMAPEQARGERDVDARADLFSLGCVLFQCLSGEPPFSAQHVIALLAKVLLEEPKPLRSLRPSVPPQLADLVSRLMQKRPEHRPESADVVLQRLAEMAVHADSPSSSVLTVEAPPLSEHLTTGERRLLAVILVAPPDKTVAADQAVSEVAATVLSEVAVQGAGSLTEAAEAHGGVIDHLVDGTVVLTASGVGVATDRAALSARLALAVRPSAQGVPMVLSMGLGLSGGRAPVGEVIERAALLLRQTRNRGVDSGIAVDDLTAGLLGDRFEVRRAKGGLWLERERDLKDADVRLFLGRQTPCVGRDRELSLLEDEVDEAVNLPSARAVLLLGDAGVGKSRLRHEFVRRLSARETPPTVWIARGDPLTERSPFGLLGQIVQRAAGIVAGEPPASRCEKLTERCVRIVGPEGRRVAEFLGELCGTHFPDDGNVQLRAARNDPMIMGDQMLRAWVDWVAAETLANPVVLILEDLHWGDLPTVQYVDAALRLLTEHPILVLALARPIVDNMYPNLWRKRRFSEIRLGALPRRAALDLARDVLGSRADPKTLDQLWTQSAGNPLFLEELLRATVEGRGGRAPSTVLAMVQTRLESLSADGRRALRAASIYGQRFWSGGAKALLGIGEVDSVLAALADDELVSRARDSKFAGQVEYAFRHALVREAAYASLTEQDRATGHRLAAEWLLVAGEPSPLVLAEHFEFGGVKNQAAVWFRKAAEQAFEGNDLDQALVLSTKAADCVQGDSQVDDEWVGETYLFNARVTLWRGQNRESVKWGTLAQSKLPQGSIRRVQALVETAVAAARLHDLDAFGAALESLSAAPVPAVSGDKQAEVCAVYMESLARVGRLALFMGRRNSGFELIRRAEAVLPHSGGNRIAAAQVNLSNSIEALLEGDLSKNLQLAEAARTQFEEAGDRLNACQQVANVAYAYLNLGCWEAAARCSRDAMVQAEHLGITALHTTAKLNLALATAFCGSFEEGERLGTEVIASAESHADRRVIAFVHIYLARMCMVAGHHEKALQHSSAIADDPSALSSLRAFALACSSLALGALGQVDAAVATGKEALDLLAELGSVEEGEALIRLAYPSALAKRGDRAAAADATLDARAKLLAHAAKITDDKYRQSYLTAVFENAETLRLADELNISV
ncbi:MAG: protein kinase [Polyangiaceae bacterium]|nr:protein kinase [Polyangiaceae bacterium]